MASSNNLNRCYTSSNNSSNIVQRKVATVYIRI